ERYRLALVCSKAESRYCRTCAVSRCRNVRWIGLRRRTVPGNEESVVWFGRVESEELHLNARLGGRECVRDRVGGTRLLRTSTRERRCVGGRVEDGRVA